MVTAQHGTATTRQSGIPRASSGWAHRWRLALVAGRSDLLIGDFAETFGRLFGGDLARLVAADIARRDAPE